MKQSVSFHPCVRVCATLGIAGLFIATLQRPAHATPTAQEVDTAIKICTVGTAIDGTLQAGLDALKTRLLSGSASLTIHYSEIPSVIGTPLVDDRVKERVFYHIQDCVVKHTYGERDTYPVWQPKNYVYGASPAVVPVTDCSCVSKEVIYETVLPDTAQFGGQHFRCVKASYRYYNRCQSLSQIIFKADRAFGPSSV